MYPKTKHPFDETLVRWISALLCDHTVFIIPSAIHSNHGPSTTILNKIHIIICNEIQTKWAWEHFIWDAEEIKRIGKHLLQNHKNLRKIPSTVNCQVIQNDQPERCSNTCTLQNGLYYKKWGLSCFSNNKITYHIKLV